MNKNKLPISIIIPVNLLTGKIFNQIIKNPDLHLCEEIMIITTIKAKETTASNIRIIGGVKGRAKARNVGIDNAKGEYILFLDEDQIVEKGLLRECALLAQKGKFDMIIIPEVFIGDGVWGSASACWRNCVSIIDSEIPRFYRKAFLKKVGKLNENLELWEDLELYMRAKRLRGIVGMTTHKIYHPVPRELKWILKRAFNYGIKTKKALKTLGNRIPVNKILLTIKVIREIITNPNISITIKLATLILLIFQVISYGIGLLGGFLNESTLD